MQWRIKTIGEFRFALILFCSSLDVQTRQCRINKCPHTTPLINLTILHLQRNKKGKTRENANEKKAKIFH